MNTVRSCFTATVAFLVVAIGGRIAIGGRVAFGLNVASSMNNIVWVRKRCPVDRMYDPEGRFCRPSGTGGDEYEQRLMNRLQSEFRMTADVRLKSIYEGPPYCFSTDVLVDVSTEEVRGLMEAHPSPILLPLEYWFDMTPSDELVAQTCRPRDQYCGRSNYTCVNKCSPVGFIFVDDFFSSVLGYTKSEMPFTLSAYETDPEGSPVGRSNNTVLQNYDRHFCDVIELIDDRYMLTMDGNLFLIHEGVKWIIPAKEFCLEYYTDGRTPADLRAFLCTNAKPPVSFIFWIKVLSLVCLVLTLIVYSTLPYLRNTQGYYVMFYMACQLVYFVFNSIYDLVQDDINNPLCIPFGYFSYFTTLTTCCWLNVICLDIYWMLRYNNSTNRNTSKLVRTIMYHIYCWGFSSICVSTGYLFQQSQNEKLLELAPNIGEYDCFFDGIYAYGNLIFYWLPTCGMLTANLIFFLLTAIQCSRIKSELNKFRRTDSKIEMFLFYKEKFAMSMKLFLVFGMPFLFLILSEFFQLKGTKKVIIKAISNLQGVYIFIIFVAKSKVIMDLRKKFQGSMDYSEVTQMNTIPGSS